MNLANEIAQKLSALDYEFPAQDTPIQEYIHRYLLLIEKWNRMHNLTAIRKPEDMLSQHIMDSLSVLPYINGPKIIDVGSGAGLPGIPIALARPDWQVVLLDSNHKKTTFLQQVIIELGLKNITVVTQRVEQLQIVEGFNTVITRAFSSLSNFIHLAGHLCDNNNENSRLVAMKADSSDEERAQVPRQYEIETVVTVSVPGLDAKRQLIMIKKNNLST